MDAVRRHVGLGLVLLLVSSAAFATSGPFAKSLIGAGWTPSAVVLTRIAGAALLLGPWAAWSLRGRWRAVRHELPLTAAYGVLAVACAQLGYFQAIQRLPVSVALLIEYLGIVVVVLWVWATTRRPPSRLTVLGALLAIGGLALVLDVSGAVRPDLVGVAWALLAATGMGGHYVIAAHETVIPAPAFAALGLVVGAVILALLGALGVLPMHTGAPSSVLAGHAVPAWIALAELVLIAAAAAYVLGVIGARHLGSTLASFVGLVEVLFVGLFAWLLLGELPRPVQALGGVLILGGVVAVRIGELRREREQPGAEGHVDFPTHSPVA